MPRLLPEDELNAAFGLETAATTTVQIIFQGLGAALIVAMAYNYSAFAWINAATFCLAILPLKLTWPRLIKAEKEIPLSQKPDQSLLSNIADAWLELKKHSFILLTIALAVIINFLGASMNGLINVALLGERTMWLGNYGNTVALLDIILSVGTILGSLLMNDFLKNSRLLTLLLLAGASLAALGVSFIWHQALILAAVSLFAAGYIAGKVNPRISALMVREIPNEKMPGILTKADGVMANAETVSSNLAAIDVAGTMAKVDATLANVEKLTTTLNSKEGTVGLLLHDPGLYNNMTSKHYHTGVDALLHTLQTALRLKPRHDTGTQAHSLGDAVRHGARPVFHLL